MKLADYIDRKFGGSRAEFARHMSTPEQAVSLQKVNKWLTAGMIVHIDDDGRMYLCTLRREIPVIK
ncbi:hypothetical protein HLB27_03410 [Dickeya dadantii]|uniref:hypothetical protein n=1 Tax=Dickeya dadantii TaxID=204038 RepID=UPI0014957A29|nr:hypothetical protein [Dickeya dadantii]NPE57711.1 hypothetical protein [Dickeya dadantii]NPE69815.1 hypothetical protein [Dickeya dadantii]